MPTRDALSLTGNDQLFRWNIEAPVGTSVVVTYSFSTGRAGYDTESRPGFTALTSQQKGYARDALATWANASGIEFVEVPASVGGQIRFGIYDIAETGIAGFAYFPEYSSYRFGGATSYENIYDSIGGDIFLAADLYANKSSELAPGKFGYTVLMHEIGHALGFKHPFEGTPTILPTHDNATYTVMSYNVPATTVSLGSADLEAIRYLYGTSDLAMSWDAATLTLTRSGTANAEYVLGTELKDRLYGAGGDDVLSGGAGNDFLDGGAGSDRLDGGAGDDTVVWDADDVAANVLGGDGYDTLDITSARAATSLSAIAPVSFDLDAHGFEAARVMTTFSGSDGSVTRAEWTVDSDWIATSQFVRQNFADGSRRDTGYDLANKQAYAHFEDEYNAASQRVQLRTYYDDNTRRTTGYDVTNAQTYATYEEDYTTAGLRSQLRTYYDDSTRRTTGYDTGSLTWTSYEEDYNTSGARTAIRTYSDDGTRRTTQYDPARNANWSLIEESFNASGQRTRQITDYDDGVTNRARLDTSWDVANNQTWSSQTTQYDNLGNVVRMFGVDDSGNPFG